MPRLAPRQRALLAALAGALALATTPALGDFPQDAPNDPNYAAAEADCSGTSVNDEQHYLYAWMSACTPNASAPDGAAGMSIDSAWRDFTPGRPDVKVAYIEGGINWFRPDAKDLVNQVFLNAGELPPPTTPAADGRLNAKDYSDTPDSNHNGFVDAEDVIVRFSDHRDQDRNGYTDDISGWDFYDDQNDPATYDATYPHANNQMRQLAGEANNGLLGAGVCPGCTIIPIKAGAEALDRTDDLAEAWLYAGDIGAKVIVSVTADLGYSTFMNQAVKSLWRKGIVMVESSNDFDSTDHQGGMFHPYVIPGNGFVTNSRGIPGPEANLLTTTFTARSGETSWGTKNFTTVSTQSGSTSTSTPTHGGVFALVLSAGLKAAGEHKITKPLTGPEAVQVVRATASDIDDPQSNWQSRPGWDLQFGYGRPNVHRAMEAVFAGKIPPVGWMASPEWYALYDPMQTRAVAITGHVEARRSRRYSWKLEYALGAEPADGDFKLAGSGAKRRPFDGRLGTLDLDQIPKSFWERKFRLSRTKSLETNEQYTVTLRLRVTDAAGRVGEDRRTIAVHHDPSWKAGFPKRIGPAGESQAQLADLQGTGRLAAVFGDADGRVHAIDGVTGKELRGFPVLTRKTHVTRRHKGIDPGHEPILANVAIGDLDASGRLSVVAATTTGRVYVWDASGKLRPGWPKTLAAGVAPPPVPRAPLDFTRLPIRGSTASPVLVDLDGDGRLDVVQAGWNGRLHAWRRSGRAVPGWPVEVTVPDGLAPPSGQVRINDHKLIVPPAVADLDGDNKPELVIRSQYFDTPGADIQFNGRTHVHAYHADGKPVAGFPRKLVSLVIYYGSAQEFITEGSNAPVAADTDGDGRDEIAVSALFSPSALLDSDGSDQATFGPLPDLTLGLLKDPQAAAAGALPADALLSFTTSGAFGKVGSDALAYAEPGSGGASVVGALLVTGSGQPIKNVMRAFDPDSGLPLSGFPADTQGLDFLGAPAIADVDGDGRADVLEGGDSSALHAFNANGEQAAGFPKWHTGWVVYSPTVGDLDSDSKTDVVAVTREGYLFEWSTPAPATTNTEWWSARHDERNSARYGVDTRPPGIARDATLTRDRSAVSFVAPGDDWYSGRAARYRVIAVSPRGRRTINSEPVSGAAGVRETIPLPAGTRRVVIQARDEVGNLGTPVTLPRPRSKRR